MNVIDIKKYLELKLAFTKEKIDKVSFYVDLLLNFNKKYNLIGKSTEKDIWSRHILDCAQLVKFIDFSKNGVLSDLGSGAGLPGVIISIANNNPKFHVKLYEKSPIKRIFLEKIQNLSNYEIEANIYDYKNIETDYIVCRAFKKLGTIFEISREKVKNPHKIIILKGKKALIELKKLSNLKDYRYKTVDSVSNVDSKIIIAEKE